MSGRHFPVISSVAEPTALARLLRDEYEFARLPECRLFRRSVGDAYQVTLKPRTWYLKVHLPHWRPKKDIQAEVEFLNFLTDRRIAVGRPVARKDGGYLTKIGAPEGVRWAVLYAGARGGDLEEANIEHARLFGRAVARMHNAADRIPDGFRAPRIDFAHLVDDQLAVVEPFMKHRKSDFRFIRKVGEEAKAAIEPRLSHVKPQWGLCHGDLHGGDVRIDGRKRVTLFDFSSFGYGWRAIDVGVFLASHDWMATGRKEKLERRRRWRAFLEGYSPERPLAAAEIEAAELSVPVRHIYLMGVPLVCWSAIAGQHWVHDGYFDWHMKWFRSWHDAGGPKLLV